MIPFCVALYQAFKLLSYIDKNRYLSEFYVNSQKNIKFCAMTISGLYAMILPFAFLVAELDDAPALIIIGMVPVFASMVITLAVYRMKDY